MMNLKFNQLFDLVMNSVLRRSDGSKTMSCSSFHGGSSTREISTRRSFLFQVLIAVVLLNLVIGFSIPSSVMAQDAKPGELSAEAEPVEFLGVPLFDDDIYKMAVRFCFNLVFLSLVVGVSYGPNRKSEKRYVFNFLIMNVVVFFICFALKKLDLGVGMALGLFAIFAIIRYRTEQIEVKEMTYLFVVIGLAVINALSNKKTSYAELVFVNLLIFLSTYVLEKMLVAPPKAPKLLSRDIIYDKLELLHPGREEDLKNDLRERTGIEAKRIDIKKVDLKSQTAAVVIRYPRSASDSN